MVPGIEGAPQLVIKVWQQEAAGGGKPRPYISGSLTRIDRIQCRLTGTDNG